MQDAIGQAIMAGFATVFVFGLAAGAVGFLVAAASLLDL
jgi:hypothetical protein